MGHLRRIKARLKRRACSLRLELVRAHTPCWLCLQDPSLNRDGFAALLQAVAHRRPNNSSSLAEVAEVAVIVRQMVLELAVGTTVEEETEILVPMVVEVELWRRWR